MIMKITASRQDIAVTDAIYGYRWFPALCSAEKGKRSIPSMDANTVSSNDIRVLMLLLLFRMGALFIQDTYTAVASTTSM